MIPRNFHRQSRSRNYSKFLLISIIGSLLALLVTYSFLPGSGAVMRFFLCATILFYSVASLHFQIGLLNIRRPTIPSFFFWTYIFIIFLPAFDVYDSYPGQHRDKYLFFVTSALLTVPIGIALASFAMKFHPNEIARFYGHPLESAPSQPRRFLFFLGLFGLGLLTTLYYLSQVKTIPILYLIRNPGSYSDIAILRNLAGVQLHSMIIYPYYYYMILVYPFLSMIALGSYVETKNRLWGIIFLGTLTTAVIHASFTTAKSPVAQMLFMVLTYYYILRAKTIRISWLIAGVFGVFTFPFLVTSLSYSGTLGLMDAANGLYLRIFYKPTWLLYKYVEVFPDIVPYLYGASIEKLAILMNVEYFNVPNYMAHVVHPTSNVESGNANVAFLGNLNCDFGLPGVLAGGCLAGLVMQTFQAYLLRKRKTIYTVAAMAYLIVIFHLLNHTALNLVLLSYGSFYILILCWLANLTEISRPPL